jgi:glutamine amidotransferase
LSVPDVVVIDYGVGNLLSVQRGLEHCGANVTVTADPDQILAARRVVLPGVGAFGNALDALDQLKLFDVIREVANRDIWLLGICLGMQLLLDESQEFGKTSGLGLIPGRVIPVPSLSTSGEIQKVPHIGWNSLYPAGASADWKGTLLEGINRGDATYFVHSFMAVPAVPENRIADCLYGGHRIASVIGRGRVIGCQFHPEKSGEVGLAILRKFIQQ